MNKLFLTLLISTGTFCMEAPQEPQPALAKKATPSSKSNHGVTILIPQPRITYVGYPKGHHLYKKQQAQYNKPAHKNA